MFGIDFSEILVIFGIALVVLGPERLPKVAATIGRWIGRARAMARQFREQLEQETSGLQQSMNLGPEFDPRAAAAQSAATAATPNIRPPTPSTPTGASETTQPSDASIAAAREAIAPSPAAAPAPVPQASGAGGASAGVSGTDLTTPTAAAMAETAEAESSFEYGLAHTHISALHPAPASSANSAPTSAHANGSATHGVAAADDAGAVTGPGEPQQHTLWPS